MYTDYNFRIKKKSVFYGFSIQRVPSLLSCTAKAKFVQNEYSHSRKCIKSQA